MVCAKVALPPTVVIPRMSKSGDGRAIIKASASSVPGSVSMITLTNDTDLRVIKLSDVAHLVAAVAAYERLPGFA